MQSLSSSELPTLTKNLLFFSRTISQVHREVQTPRHSVNLYWKNKHITNTVFQYFRLFDQLRFAFRGFYSVVFWATKLKWLNRSEAVLYKTVVLMDYEIIWLKAFVLIAFLFALHFHDCLTKPAWRWGRMQWPPESFCGQHSACLCIIHTQNTIIFFKRHTRSCKIVLCNCIVNLPSGTFSLSHKAAMNKAL